MNRIETKLLRPGSPESNHAELVLQTGTRAGTQAPLQQGYYMIGRHKECQIRPKSRSVSRRHCLIHHEAGGIKVLDLESTSGTRVNEEKLDPLVWVPLTDGDMLRCGKIVFRVSLTAQQPEPAESEAAYAARGRSMVSGQAWQEVDIADYLDSEDEADRERRYDTIRGRNEAADSSDDQASEVLEESDVFADDMGFGEPSEPAVATAKSTTAKASATAARPATDSKPKPVRPPKQSKPGRLPKGKRRAVASSGRSIDWERWKLIGAAVLVVTVVGYFGYAAYHAYQGPDVRVLEGLD